MEFKKVERLVPEQKDKFIQKNKYEINNED